MFTIAFVCVLYCFGIASSIVLQVIYLNIDSREKWDYEKPVEFCSVGWRIIISSTFWIIFYPIFGLVQACVYLYKAISFIGLKLLDKVFSFNKKILAAKEKKYVQLQAKDYRTPPQLVEICSECNRRYDA
jgi:hypothetical protein